MVTPSGQVDTTNNRVLSYFNRSDSLQRMGDEGVCKVSSEPSGPGMLTRNTSRARVLFFLEPARPIRASTSALRSFRMPTQSTLQQPVESK